MQRHEIFIPTIYSHCIFVDSDEQQTMLTKNQFNYFWAIIYLYRNKLLLQKPDGFIPADDKSKKRSKLNPDTKWDDIFVKINYSEIQKVIKGKNSGDQSELKKFIDIFKKLFLKTNLFGKSLDPVGKIVKPVKQIQQSFKHIEIQLTKEFIVPLLITDGLFKKVALNFMFWLPTYKSKVLYLLFKDYDKFHKNFTINDIENMVGTVFSNNRIDRILEYIDTITDIYVDKLESEFLEDTFKYTVLSQLKFVNDEEEIDYFTKKLISKEVQRRIDHENQIGNVIKDEKAYSKKAFAQIINDEVQKDKFETMAVIDIFLKDKKEELLTTVDNEKTGYWYVCIRLEINGEIKQYTINDQYNLREAILPTIITTNPDQTYEKVQQKVDYQTYFSENELQDSTKSLIQLT